MALETESSLTEIDSVCLHSEQSWSSRRRSSCWQDDEASREGSGSLNQLLLVACRDLRSCGISKAATVGGYRVEFKVASPYYIRPQTMETPVYLVLHARLPALLGKSYLSPFFSAVSR